MLSRQTAHGIHRSKYTMPFNRDFTLRLFARSRGRFSFFNQPLDFFDALFFKMILDKPAKLFHPAFNLLDSRLIRRQFRQLDESANLRAEIHGQNGNHRVQRPHIAQKPRFRIPVFALQFILFSTPLRSLFVSLPLRFLQPLFCGFYESFPTSRAFEFVANGIPKHIDARIFQNARLEKLLRYLVRHQRPAKHNTRNTVYPVIIAVRLAELAGFQSLRFRHKPPMQLVIRL